MFLVLFMLIFNSFSNYFPDQLSNSSPRRDRFEKLMYEIFVTSDERTSIRQLAHFLNSDVALVKDAVSLYCR